MFVEEGDEVFGIVSIIGIGTIHFFTRSQTRSEKVQGTTHPDFGVVPDIGGETHEVVVDADR